MKKKIIFLHSISPRSGHNFIAEVIRLCIETTTPIGLRSEIPFGVFIDNYQKFKKTIFGSEGYHEYFDKLFIDDLRDKIIVNENVLIKYTNLEGAFEVKKMFPDDVHIISIRNPNDVLTSIFKGMKFSKNFKSKVKKILIPFGIYHYWYAKQYANKILKILPELDDFLILKYEDIVTKKTDTLLKLQQSLGVNVNIEVIDKKMDEIKIINTSFFKEETKAQKVWDSTVKTEKFNPLNRKYLRYHQRKLIELGSRELIKKLGY